MNKNQIDSNKKIAVMGHLCLDIFPSINNIEDVRFAPGKLNEIGPCKCFPGGAVGNTGLVLAKLGLPIKLSAKIGDDSFGFTVSSFFNHLPSDATKSITTIKGGNTGYAIVLSPPSRDRMFLAYRGVNDDISSSDITDEFLDEVAILHFGYPPLCKTIAENNGKELEKTFRHAGEKNIITSLDMSLPSPGSLSEKIDWISFLKNVMPQTDVFSPSIDELQFMFKSNSELTLESLNRFSQQLINWGTAVVVIKLGAEGLYIKTSKDIQRLRKLQQLIPDNLETWIDKEFITPCYKVEVKGTTGAGDSTIAGFLSGIVTGQSIEQSARIATGVGAHCVTEHDVISGIKPLREIIEKINSDWETHPINIA